MAELLYGALVLLIMVGLVIGVAIYRRRRFVDVYREEEGKLLYAAEILVVGVVIAAFLILMVVNNGWLK